MVAQANLKLLGSSDSPQPPKEVGLRVYSITLGLVYVLNTSLAMWNELKEGQRQEWRPKIE